MISHKDMLNIIATEAIEGGESRHYADERHHEMVLERRVLRNGKISARGPRVPPKVMREMNVVKYGLRLVQESDGALKWVDE